MKCQKLVEAQSITADKQGFQGLLNLRILENPKLLAPWNLSNGDILDWWQQYIVCYLTHALYIRNPVTGPG